MKMLSISTTIGIILASAVTLARPCATVYNSRECSHRGSELIMSGDSITDLNGLSLNSEGRQTDWDNKISRVVVEPNCTFIGYQYQDYNINYHTGHRLDGFTLVLDNTRTYRPIDEVLTSYYDDKISSLSCYCR